MDLSKYAAGKASGDSSVALQGSTTLLVRVPGGFDPESGVKRPSVEQGFQRADLAKAREAAADAVTAAQAEVTKAQAHLASCDVLLADADEALSRK